MAIANSSRPRPPVMRLALSWIIVVALSLAISATAASPPAPAPTAAATAAPRKRKKPVKPAEPARLPTGLKVPVYPPGAIPFRDGQRLTYRASWLGIPVAEARVELHSHREDPAMLTAEAWVETNRFADIFFRMRDYMKEDMSRATLQTREVYFLQHENERLNEYFVTFDRTADLVTAVKKNRKSRVEKRFVANNSYGPLTGAIMALSQPGAPGSVFMFDVFTGNHRYVFDFKVGKVERITVPAGTFDAYRIVPGIVYLSDEDLRKKSRYTLVWVSADERRLPLRVEAGTFIGSVRVDLIRIDNPPAVALR
ncbi:MAG: DUF3108 domain-containing protein [Candidatus Binataceae bacterium]